MKSILKRLTPPLILDVYRKIFNAQFKSKEAGVQNNWSGNYSSWNEALKNTSGYDDQRILEKCRTALLKVKNGEAKYERDSVLFDEIEYSWPLLATLQRSALENNNKLTVLDFGGSLGSTYFQNKGSLSNNIDLSWHIVEQKIFVDEGKKHFEDDSLKFFYTIEESMKQKRADVVILSSVLQYLEHPHEMLSDILSLRAPYIVIDLTTFIETDSDILTIQTVPESIYKASYPAWFFSLARFKDQLLNYEIISEFNVHEGLVISLDNGVKASYKGFILKLKEEK